MVGNAVRHAVGLNYFLNLSKLVCRHSREQVVFDLAGEASSAVINSRMLLNVPAGEHLLTQKVHRRGALQQGHALMIRGEYQSQIQSQEHLLRHEEQDGMWPAEKKIEEAQKPAGVQNEKTDFNEGMRDLVAQQEFNTVNFQHKCFEQRQREETEVLVFHREPCEPALCSCLVLGKCEQRYIDIGIGGNVIWGTMMMMVLVEPPTVAETEQEI